MIKLHLRWLIINPLKIFFRIFEISLLTLALVIGMYLMAQTQDVSIKASIKPDSLTVGDRFLYVNRISNIGSKSIVPTTTGESLGDVTILSKIFTLDKQPAGTIAYACTAAVYKPGQINIPSFSFAVSDSSGKIQQIQGDSLAVMIHSILPADTAGLDIADIRGPRKIPGPIWPYILAVAIIALGIFAYIKLRKYFTRKISTPIIPGRPAWDIAIEKLDELKKARHRDFGRFKEFYFELTMILRGYIEGRYGIQAVESTTYELENDAKLAAIENELYKRLFELFYHADPVKFAKSVPTSEEALADIEFAYEFISKTKPIVATQSIQPEDQKVNKIDVQV